MLKKLVVLIMLTLVVGCTPSAEVGNIEMLAMQHYCSVRNVADKNIGEIKLDSRWTSNTHFFKCVGDKDWMRVSVATEHHIKYLQKSRRMKQYGK